MSECEKEDQEHSFESSQESIHSIPSTLSTDDHSGISIPMTTISTTNRISIHPHLLLIDKMMDDTQDAVVNNNSIIPGVDISSNDGKMLESNSTENSMNMNNENENENVNEVEKAVDYSSCLTNLPGQEDLLEQLNTLPYPTSCFLSHSSNPLNSIPIPMPKPMPILMEKCNGMSDIFDYTTSLQQ